MTPGIASVVLPQVRGTSKADGFAGHFIASDNCRFRLHHHVLSVSGQRYRVSTVGALTYERHGGRIEIERIGIGPDDYYETMVFAEDDVGEVSSWTELHCVRSKDSVVATAAHYDLVAQYEQEGAA